VNQHSTNYTNTFIEVADDCPVTTAEVPPQKGDKKTVARLQYDMIHDHPYRYTSDDVLFAVYAARQGVAEQDDAAERDRFFSKGQPCIRASPLPKRYGWGIYSDDVGKLALVAIEDPRYSNLAHDPSVNHLKAMRLRKA
jgi:hypothetical protein